MIEEQDYAPTNREKVRMPKMGWSICACDRVEIGDGQTCPNCKRKQLTRRALARDARKA